MNTKSFKTLFNHIEYSTFFTVTAYLCIFALILDNWERYGGTSTNIDLFGGFLTWLINITFLVSILEGVVKLYQKKPVKTYDMAPLNLRHGRLHLYILTIYIATSAICRIFLPEVIDRIMSLYIGPVLGMGMVLNGVIALVRKPSKKLR